MKRTYQNCLRYFCNKTTSNQNCKININSSKRIVSNKKKSRISFHDRYSFTHRKWTPASIKQLNVYMNEKHNTDTKKEKWVKLILYYKNYFNRMNKDKMKYNKPIDDNVMLLLDYFIDFKLIAINRDNKLYLEGLKLNILLNVIDIYYSMNNFGKSKVFNIVTNLIKSDVSISLDILEYVYTLFGSNYYDDVIKLIDLWIMNHKYIVKIINLENIYDENFAMLVIDQFLKCENNSCNNKFSTLLLFISQLRKSKSRIYFHTNLILYFYQKYNIRALDYINDSQFGKYYKAWNNISMFINKSKFSPYIIRLLNYSKIEVMNKMCRTPLIIEIPSNQIKSYANNDNIINLNDSMIVTSTNPNIFKFSLIDVKLLIDVENLLTFSSFVRQQLSRNVNMSKFIKIQGKEKHYQKSSHKEISYYKNAYEDIKLINNELNIIVNNLNEQIRHV